MSGLKVDIQNSTSFLFNKAHWVPLNTIQAPPANTPNATLIFTASSPYELNTLVDAWVATNDGKCYLRQSKRDIYIQNEAGPGWLRATYFRVRANIPKGTFADWYALLGDESASNSSWATPLTLSNTAQRYLKFGKTKLIKMLQGGTHHIKLNTKFKQRYISHLVEANLNDFLGTTITKGVILKWIPAPRSGYNGATDTAITSITTVAPSPYLVNIMCQTYTSLYVLNDKDPYVGYTAQSADPAYYGGIMLPGNQHIDASKIL